MSVEGESVFVPDLAPAMVRPAIGNGEYLTESPMEGVGNDQARLPRRQSLTYVAFSSGGGRTGKPRLARRRSAHDHGRRPGRGPFGAPETHCGGAYDEVILNSGLETGNGVGRLSAVVHVNENKGFQPVAAIVNGRLIVCKDYPTDAINIGFGRCIPTDDDFAGVVTVGSDDIPGRIQTALSRDRGRRCACAEKRQNGYQKKGGGCGYILHRGGSNGQAFTQPTPTAPPPPVPAGSGDARSGRNPSAPACCRSRRFPPRCRRPGPGDPPRRRRR